MRKITILLLALFALSLSSPAQTRKRRTTSTPPTQKEQLQKRQRELRQQQQQSRKRQQELEKQVKERMRDVEALGSEIDDKRVLLDSLNVEIDSLNVTIDELSAQLSQLQEELEDRRQHYIQSVRYMYRNHSVQNRMMFVLSAQNASQIYRRMRFMNEYTKHQTAQGEAVKQKGEQVEVKLAELNAARQSLDTLRSQGRHEQAQLESKKEQQQKLVADLQKEQQTVRKLITQQQQEEEELNKQIDRLIAEELERARQAELERQRQQEAQQQREREQAQANNNNNNGNSSQRRNNNSNSSSSGNNRSSSSNNRSSSGRNRSSSSNSRSSSGRNRSTASTSTGSSNSGFTNGDPDRQLTGSFASNKGRLPVPITGSYRVIRNFGKYTIGGVTLKSSGIHLEGQSGAQARCVFDGKVSSIYNPGNGIVVMVRHGRYISVYSNLSSVNVSMGQKVKTNQILGNVGASHVLQFRLQNWDKVLNPKTWLKRL